MPKEYKSKIRCYHLYKHDRKIFRSWRNMVMKTFDKKTGNETKRLLGVLVCVLALGLMGAPVRAYVEDPVTPTPDPLALPTGIPKKAGVDERKVEEATEETTCETETTSMREEEQEEASQAQGWDGPVLSASAGVVEGPSGRETYYNLDMTPVIDLLRSQGYTDEYWVREDGCKMFGEYIMCAANYDLHPFGSLVESSLGTCIVCDTGGFAAADPTQLDIATTW